MRHRQAEGDVLRYLGHGPQQLGGSAGMLYRDPTWLRELIRRLTDHTLADTSKEGTLKNDLEKYGEEHNPPLELDMLWEQHREVHNGIVRTERRPTVGKEGVHAFGGILTKACSYNFVFAPNVYVVPRPSAAAHSGAATCCDALLSRSNSGIFPGN